MTDPENEWISAHLDEELAPAARARGSRALIREPEARRRLGRYQLIGDAMRKELPERLHPGLARRVHQKIVQESVSASPSTHPALRGVWRWIRRPVPLVGAGGLLATFGAVGLWFYAQGLPSLPAEGDRSTGPVAEIPQSELDARARQQILIYLAAHAEVEPRTLMPYAQLAEYEE